MKEAEQQRSEPREPSSKEEQRKASEEEQREQAREAQAEQAPKPMDERQLARDQWLRRIPDDPGELLRRKFRYYYQRQNHEAPKQNPW